jgi:hypothetical protein
MTALLGSAWSPLRRAVAAGEAAPADPSARRMLGFLVPFPTPPEATCVA